MPLDQGDNNEVECSEVMSPTEVGFSASLAHAVVEF